LEIGHWKLVIRNWSLEIGHWKFVINKIEIGTSGGFEIAQ
jgi:hypothetical protein